MTWPKRKQAQDERRKRRQKHELAFLFTVEGHLLGDVERVPWEVALADSSDIQVMLTGHGGFATH